MRKIYHAIVHGLLAEDTGTWTDFMRKVPDQAQAEFVPQAHPEAREAVLHFRVLKRYETAEKYGQIAGLNGPATKLEIELETGRMHQIRLQCGGRGHAILGDRQYGSTVPFGEQYEDERLRAIALHAARIEFRLPTPPFEFVTVMAPVAW